MSKRFVLNSLKYALAFGLLAYVLWRNWGYSGKVASTITPGEAALADSHPESLTLTGQVTAYHPGKSITLQDPVSKEETEFALTNKTTIEQPDAIEPGRIVSVQEGSERGLAYVWKKHVIEHEPIQVGFLILAALILLGALLLSFGRWYLLVRALDLPFSLANALRLGAIGFLFNSFLPGSVGGDVIKAAFLARDNANRRTAAVATVLIDRAIALWALIWFVALLGTVFWVGGLLHGEAERQSKTIVVGAAIIVGVTVLVWGFLGVLPAWRAERFAGRLSRLPKVGMAASEFWRAIWMYRQRPRTVAAAMLMSLVGHVGFVLTFYFSARTLLTPGAGDLAQKIPSLAEHFLIVPIGMVIQAMPLFPGGAGIGELGFGGLYRWLGCPAANGVLGSLVQRVLTWVLGLLGYVVYLRMKPSLQTVVHEPTQLATADA